MNFPVTLGGAIIALVCGELSCGALPAAPVRPNVVFISIDDLNDWVGCLGGHPQARTPSIDALAAGGVNFTNAHCQAPICNCSRVSMLLGKQPSTTGMYFLSPNFREAQRTKDEQTLFQYFRQYGYYVSTRGKIFHGRPDPSSFDHIERTTGWRRPKTKISYVVPGSHPLWDWGRVQVPDRQQRDFQTAAWAADEIDRLNKRRQQQGQPFFLAVGFHLPHVPMYASKKWFDLYPLDQLQLPAVLADDRADLSRYALQLTLNPTGPRHKWMLQNDQWKPAVQSYLATVSFVDSLVGRVLNALEQSDAAKQTVVVLWSDHGFHLGEKLRWAKRTLWEETTRVPLIVTGPQIRPAVCAAPVGLIDVFPTLNELCALPRKPDLEGQSLVPLIEDPDTPWERPALTTFGPGNHSLRTTHRRYIRYSDGTEEVYDLRTDPHEWHNLASRPEVQAFKQSMQRWLPQQNASPLPGSSGSDSPLYDKSIAVDQ